MEEGRRRSSARSPPGRLHAGRSTLPRTLAIHGDAPLRAAGRVAGAAQGGQAGHLQPPHLRPPGLRALPRPRRRRVRAPRPPLFRRSRCRSMHVLRSAHAPSQARTFRSRLVPPSQRTALHPPRTARRAAPRWRPSRSSSPQLYPACPRLSLPVLPHPQIMYTRRGPPATDRGGVFCAAAAAARAWWCRAGSSRSRWPRGLRRAGRRRSRWGPPPPHTRTNPQTHPPSD